MQIDCAPMEGITGRLFRKAHNKWFGGIDRYFMPFLSPTQTHTFAKKEWKEILPENNEGLRVVPQLLTRNYEDFLWAAKELSHIGYQEVNLNLGCPSGTVVAKGKGSGFLGYPEELREFLDRIYSACPIRISIKTRLGLSDPEEFPHLLDIFQQFPVHELIVHPRIQRDFYKYPVRMDMFASCISSFKVPVCYNGDLSTAEQCKAFCANYPSIGHIMLGRGLIGDPAMARKALGGKAAEQSSLRSFHDQLYEDYCTAFNSRRNAMMRMKEIWFYLIGLFEDSSKAGKALRKTQDPVSFESQVDHIFRTLPLCSSNPTSCS